MDEMKKKQMLATMVMLSLLQGSVYAKDSYYDKGKMFIMLMGIKSLLTIAMDIKEYSVMAVRIVAPKILMEQM